MAKLTEQQCAEIKQRFAQGESYKTLATCFGVHRNTVARVVDPEYRAQQNANSKTWYDNNPEKRRAYSRTYYAAHPKPARENVRRWEQANPERANANKRNWARRNPQSVQINREN